MGKSIALSVSFAATEDDALLIADDSFVVRAALLFFDVGITA